MGRYICNRRKDSGALEEAAAEDASAIAVPTTNGVQNVSDITNGVNEGYESRPLGKVNGVARALQPSLRCGRMFGRVP